MTPLERQQQRNAGGAECVACGGSGTASNGARCVACIGTGSKQTAHTGDKSASIAQHSSDTTEHYTPAPIVEAAREVLGGIDLDPASCSLANEVVQAAAFYGPGGLAPDGLAETWIGRVFLNPPGGRVPDEYKGLGTSSNAALWWATLASAWEAGEVEAAIFVGFTLEILRSAQSLDVPQPINFPLCVPSSRIAFDTEQQGERIASKQPTHANVIVYLPPYNGDRVNRPTVVGAEHIRGFFEAFSKFGKCRA